MMLPNISGRCPVPESALVAYTLQGDASHYCGPAGSLPWRGFRLDDLFVRVEWWQVLDSAAFARYEDSTVRHVEAQQRARWRKGPPPAAGWWPASATRNAAARRWSDGKAWSAPCDVGDPLERVEAARYSRSPASTTDVRWRVPGPDEIAAPAAAADAG